MKIANYATQTVVTVEPSDSIDRAIGLLEEHGFHHLVVADEGRVCGVLSDRDVLISTGWMLAVERTVPDDCATAPATDVVGPTRVDQIMTKGIAALSPTASAQEAATLMLERRIGALPLLDHGRLVGILTATDLLRWLDELAIHKSAAARFLSRAVGESMHTRLVCVPPRTDLDIVVDLFRRRHIRHVLVAIDKMLLGTISDRDVRRALGWSSIRDAQAEEEGRISPTATPLIAADVMERDVVTIDPTQPLRTALRRMLERRIHSLPVVESDGLVGILTQTDFVKAIAREELL